MSLRLANVSKRFEDKWVLRDTSLEVSPGEIFGILGANGSGKSTLLRVIYGAEKHGSGQISFGTHDLSALSEKERGFTFPHTEEAQSSWKNLFKSNKSNAMSEGERQKLSFEESLNVAEKVLLIDNPFCSMDKNSQSKNLQDLQQTAKEKNLAVVFVTNDYREAFAICDRVGILHRGEIVQTGTPRELYEKPLNIVVASAQGRNNFIPAMRISFNNEKTQEFQTLTGEHRLQIGKTEKRALGTITNAMTLSIRPEHISISFGASFPEDNLLRAQIIGIQYQGATTCIKLDAKGLILEALVLRLVGLNIGDECMVGLPPDRILVLKD